MYIVVDDYNAGISYIFPDMLNFPEDDLSVDIKNAAIRVEEDMKHYCHQHHNDNSGNVEIVDIDGNDAIVFSIKRKHIIKYLEERDQSNLITGV